MITLSISSAVFAHFVKMEKEQLVPNEAKGLGIMTATIFLAGEMAGSGVLALPAALKGITEVVRVEMRVH